jgi:hypothetical protein
LIEAVLPLILEKASSVKKLDFRLIDFVMINALSSFLI